MIPLDGNTTEDHAPLDERKFAKESADKARELDLKEREIAAKEREVAAKEMDLQRSRWINPMVLGLFAAALGLVGTILVARVNNQNSQDVERLRSQSNLVLEAIKTGSPDAACKNLTFFVNLGLLDDPSGTIRKACISAPQGPPSLPAAQRQLFPSHQNDPNYGATGTVWDIAGRPIEGAKVRADQGSTVETDKNGKFWIEWPGFDSLADMFILTVEKAGYETTRKSTQRGGTLTVVLRKVE